MAYVNAFAGVEGYGAGTIGGRGGQVVHVTNLNDSGTGSLRWALETVTGPRIVVFDVNGTITLNSQITIKDPYVTIAGQTAPGEGIDIQGSRLRIDASEVIVRGLHFRPGDGAGSPPGDRDAIYIGSSDDVIRNIVVDHNSFSWAIDQNLDVTGRAENVTVSSNIIAQGLNKSLHPEGAHSKGMGVGPWIVTDDPTPGRGITIVKNLIADNSARNPEIGAGANIEFVNNYVFNYGFGHLGAALGGSAGATTLRLNMIGNVYEPGLDTLKSAKGPVYLMRLTSDSALYFEDNIFTGRPVDAHGDQVQSTLYWSGTGSTQYVTGTKTFQSELHILDSRDVAAFVLADAGAGGSYGRDDVDTRLIAEVTNKTSRIVDSVAQAGGVGSNIASAAAVDTDRDGMPDWFEDLFGFLPDTADDAGDSDGDGYTNVEEYLNGFYTGFDTPMARSLVGVDALPEEADRFTLDRSDGAVTVISGFSKAEGDILDLSGVIDAATDEPPFYAVVRLNAVGPDTIVSVDRDGEGGEAAWEVIAILQGVRADNDHTLIDMSGTVFDSESPDSVIGSTRGDTVFLRTGNEVQIDTGFGADTVLLKVARPNGLIEGGTGRDSLVIAVGAPTDLSALTLRSFEQLDTGGATVSATAEQLAGFSVITHSYFAPGLPISLVMTTSGELDLGRAVFGREVSIRGADGRDVLILSNGADIVYGGGGDDRLTGAAGNDKLFGESGDDVIDGGDGIDLLDGGDGADDLLGGDARDTLFGGAGDDILNGGTDNDLLRGGAGADIYIVDSDDDAVNERFGQLVDDGAIDLVISSDDRLLTQFVENLLLVGTATLKGTGNIQANVMRGNLGDNILLGMTADDTLSSGGGSDLLDGGDGNDSLIAEASVAGSRSVLIGGAGVDSFTVARAPETSVAIADFGSGGPGEKLFAFAAASIGADLAGDAVLTFADAQTVRPTGIASHRLGYDAGSGAYGLKNDAAGVGGAAFTGTAGNDELRGAATNDRLFGGAGNDRLDGRVGADLMDGGAGNDTYFVDDGGDVVVELKDGGIDIVNATIDWRLDAEFENLQLSGAAIRATGNALANVIRGNGNDNVINGRGGLDSLYGGAGRDTFVIDALDPSSADRINDFQSGLDTLAFAGSAFGLTAGALDAAYFVQSNAGVVATADHGQFILDRYRQLYWDADGTGAGRAVMVASLGSTTITFHDIVIV